jgi:hypothetical protein
MRFVLLMTLLVACKTDNAPAPRPTPPTATAAPAAATAGEPTAPTAPTAPTSPTATPPQPSTAPADPTPPPSDPSTQPIAGSATRAELAAVVAANQPSQNLVLSIQKICAEPPKVFEPTDADQEYMQVMGKASSGDEGAKALLRAALAAAVPGGKCSALEGFLKESAKQ